MIDAPKGGVNWNTLKVWTIGWMDGWSGGSGCECECCWVAMIG